MVKLTVVRSLPDFLSAANLDYKVQYYTKSTDFGYAVIGCIDKYLCYLTIYEEEPNENGLLMIQKQFPTAEYFLDETLQSTVDLNDESNFKDIHILAQGTELQEKVWRALLEIPRGKTVFYSDIAVKAGFHSGVRACASAVGRNPVSLIIPCHRVVGKNGNVCKFGTGAVVKQRLWKSEGIFF